MFSTRTSQGLDTTTLQLFTAGRLSPSNPVSVFFGARPLKPEEAVGYSLGAALRTGYGLTGSIDLYRIDVDDRFASSPNFSVTPAIRAQLVALRVPGSDQLTSVSFFTNAFDTRTEGLDVVLGWRGEAAGGTLSLTGAYNYNDTTVTRFSTTTVSALARINLEDGLPQHSASLTGVYGRGPFEGQLRVRYSGEWTDAQFQNSANLIQAFGAKTFVDLSLSLDISPEIRATIGAENLFDEYPDEATFQATRGLIYSRNAVYDTDGRLFYARIGVNF
jgi:iron complex outermembrane receptor protein